MCKLNFYKRWNMCFTHCQLLPTIYKVKIEIKQMRLNLATLHIYSRRELRYEMTTYMIPGHGDSHYKTD